VSIWVQTGEGFAKICCPAHPYYRRIPYTYIPRARSRDLKIKGRVSNNSSRSNSE
jgi:hypothetical protein